MMKYVTLHMYLPRMQPNMHSAPDDADWRILQLKDTYVTKENC
jgi:hypothetical protein